MSRPSQPEVDRSGLAQRVRDEQARLKEEAKALSALARALTPLSKDGAYADLEKLEKTLQKVEKKMDGNLPAIVGSIREWRELAGQRMRSELSVGLRSRCEEAGLSFEVVSREDPVEVRIPPFGVVLDFARGQAELRFAKETLATCPAGVQSILSAHAKERERLERGVEPARFFDLSKRAWLAARAAAGSASERVEILDFLPYLAVEMQGQKFRRDPASANYRSYSRARFAYDVLRLRRARLMSREGWRLNFGVATGTTASQKKRVVYLEDEHGAGEYKLTVFFAREDGGKEAERP